MSPNYDLHPGHHTLASSGPILTRWSTLVLKMSVSYRQQSVKIRLVHCVAALISV